jgi:hypothetical protein
MKKHYSTRAADARTADGMDSERHLMCAVEGCPLRWSANFGEKLCSPHYLGDYSRRAAITQRIQDVGTDLAFRNQEPQTQAAVRHLTLVQKRAIGQKLRAALRNRGGRDWAQSLQEREANGEVLTEAQRTMWRAATWPFGESAQDLEPRP